MLRKACLKVDQLNAEMLMMWKCNVLRCRACPLVEIEELEDIKEERQARNKDGCRCAIALVTFLVFLPEASQSSVDTSQQVKAFHTMEPKWYPSASRAQAKT